VKTSSAAPLPARLVALHDALDDDDDVQTVWGNYDISDEVMEKLG
jgi:transcriptional/translational regulatory protein YebC/TACO1